MARTDHLIYDWNVRDAAPPPRRVELDDETLRDGLQSPSVRNPTLAEKMRILRRIDALGIDTADIGLPGAGPHVVRQVKALARQIVRERLKVRPNCAGRTLEADVAPIADVSQSAGIPVEACLFIGSSPIRQVAEDWSLRTILDHTRRSVAFAVREGLPVMYVTEDTTRARPEHVRTLNLAAVEAGASRVCLCDTVGHATPAGAASLVRFMRRTLDRAGHRRVKIDWHGHNDRGLSVGNAIAAVAAGADRVHGCALGIGERCGNTPMDVLLVNLTLMGWIRRDLTGLAEYVREVARATGTAIPPNYPVVGPDAFRTGTGVHAAAVIKALKKGDRELADRVYSGVPAGRFGFRQTIEVGPMSGKSNVVWWLESRGRRATPERVERIFRAAKKSDRVLTDAEIVRLLRRC